MKHENKHRKNIFAASVSIGTAIVLGIIKLIASFFSGSLALLASALDSMLDAIVSLINFFAIRTAAQPPDKNHPYGHGKFEALAEFLQGIFIGFSGLYLAYESILRIFKPVAIEQETIAIGIMVFSIIATTALVLFLNRTAQSTGSLVIKSDSAHYFSDVLSNFAIIGGLLIVKFTEFKVIDPILSLGISLLILHSALELLKESFDILTDHELPKEIRNKIEKILNAAKKPVTGWHLLRTRRSGTQVHIDYHLVFDDTIGLLQAHDIAEKIEDKIRKAVPHSILLTHLDPHDDSKKNEDSMQTH